MFDRAHIKRVVFWIESVCIENGISRKIERETRDEIESGTQRGVCA
jgi:hypothetical protein